MDNVLVLIAIILILIFIFIISYNQTKDIIEIKNLSYDYRDLLQNTYNYDTDMNISVKNNKKDNNNINLYQDEEHINNRGFINEVIYKPVSELKYINYEKYNISNDIRDIKDINEHEKSKDLPLGNINVHYLLKHNTSKLSL